MTIHSATLTVMTKAAHRAARHLKRDFGEVENLQVSRKGPSDFVSNADLKAESILKENLLKARPSYGFLMEESGGVEGSDPTRRWIVDPLDGTSNFLHGLPHWAISIALEENGKIIAAVIYDPIKDEMFTAEKGTGAYLNDRRIRVSGRTKLADSLLATGIPFKGMQHHELFIGELDNVMTHVAGVRRWGAATLDMAYVACGRYEAFWERNLNAWDVAAGSLIVQEAGGHISDLKSKTYSLGGPSLLVSNTQLHTEIVKLMKAQ